MDVYTGKHGFMYVCTVCMWDYGGQHYAVIAYRNTHIHAHRQEIAEFSVMIRVKSAVYSKLRFDGFFCFVCFLVFFF